MGRHPSCACHYGGSGSTAGRALLCLWPFLLLLCVLYPAGIGADSLVVSNKTAGRALQRAEECPGGGTSEWRCPSGIPGGLSQLAASVSSDALAAATSGLCTYFSDLDLHACATSWLTPLSRQAAMQGACVEVCRDLFEHAGIHSSHPHGLCPVNHVAAYVCAGQLLDVPTLVDVSTAVELGTCVNRLATFGVYECAGVYLDAETHSAIATDSCSLECEPTDAQCIAPFDGLATVDPPRDDNCVAKEAVCKRDPTSFAYRIPEEMFWQVRSGGSCDDENLPGWCWLGSFSVERPLWEALQEGSCVWECFARTSTSYSPESVLRLPGSDGQASISPSPSPHESTTTSETAVQTESQADDTTSGVRSVSDAEASISVLSFVARVRYSGTSSVRQTRRLMDVQSKGREGAVGEVDELVLSYRQGLCTAILSPIEDVQVTSVWVEETEGAALLQTALYRPSCPRAALHQLAGSLILNPGWLLGDGVLSISNLKLTESAASMNCPPDTTGRDLPKLPDDLPDTRSGGFLPVEDLSSPTVEPETTTTPSFPILLPDSNAPNEPLSTPGSYVEVMTTDSVVDETVVADHQPPLSTTSLEQDSPAPGHGAAIPAESSTPASFSSDNTTRPIENAMTQVEGPTMTSPVQDKPVPTSADSISSEPGSSTNTITPTIAPASDDNDSAKDDLPRKAAVTDPAAVDETFATASPKPADGASPDDGTVQVTTAVHLQAQVNSKGQTLETGTDIVTTPRQEELTEPDSLAITTTSRPITETAAPETNEAVSVSVSPTTPSSATTTVLPPKMIDATTPSVPMTDNQMAMDPMPTVTSEVDVTPQGEASAFATTPSDTVYVVSKTTAGSNSSGTPLAPILSKATTQVPPPAGVDGSDEVDDIIAPEPILSDPTVKVEPVSEEGYESSVSPPSATTQPPNGQPHQSGSSSSVDDDGSVVEAESQVTSKKSQTAGEDTLTASTGQAGEETVPDEDSSASAEGWADLAAMREGGGLAAHLRGPQGMLANVGLLGVQEEYNDDKAGLQNGAVEADSVDADGSVETSSAAQAMIISILSSLTLALVGAVVFVSVGMKRGWHKKVPLLAGKKGEGDTDAPDFDIPSPAAGYPDIPPLFSIGSVKHSRTRSDAMEAGALEQSDGCESLQYSPPSFTGVNPEPSEPGTVVSEDVSAPILTGLKAGQLRPSTPASFWAQAALGVTQPDDARSSAALPGFATDEESESEADEAEGGPSASYPPSPEIQAAEAPSNEGLDESQPLILSKEEESMASVRRTAVAAWAQSPERPRSRPTSAVPPRPMTAKRNRPVSAATKRLSVTQSPSAEPSSWASKRPAVVVPGTLRSMYGYGGEGNAFPQHPHRPQSAPMNKPMTSASLDSPDLSPRHIKGTETAVRPIRERPLSAAVDTPSRKAAQERQWRHFRSHSIAEEPSPSPGGSEVSSGHGSVSDPIAPMIVHPKRGSSEAEANLSELPGGSGAIGASYPKTPRGSPTQPAHFQPEHDHDGGSESSNDSVDVVYRARMQMLHRNDVRRLHR